MHATALTAAANAQLMATSLLVARMPLMAASTPVPNSFMKMSRVTLARHGTGSAAPASNRYSSLSWSVELSSPSRMLFSSGSLLTTPTKADAGYLKEIVGGMLSYTIMLIAHSYNDHALCIFTPICSNRNSPPGARCMPTLGGGGCGNAISATMGSSPVALPRLTPTSFCSSCAVALVERFRTALSIALHANRKAIQQCHTDAAIA